jgi:hypothetical protein
MDKTASPWKDATRPDPEVFNYAYALSAVDKDGNESAKTAAITEK